MITIAQVFKMFPQVKINTHQPSLVEKKIKLKNFKTLFSEAFKEGCNEFAQEMGYKTR